MKDRISSLNAEIEGYNKQLSSGELNERQTRKANRAKSKTEKNLSDWTKLNDDFDNIINDPNVIFEYSSETNVLRDDEDGLTSGSVNRDENGKAVSGTVTINIRPGHDEVVVHENRHGNQVLEGTNTKPVLERERDAFIYQRIYDYQSVQNNIDGVQQKKYGNLPPEARPNVSLDEMINNLYK